MTKYFTIVSRPDSRTPWSIEWGDYDRETVQDELVNFAAQHDDLVYRVIVSGDDQRSIDKRVRELNQADADEALRDARARVSVLTRYGTKKTTGFSQ